MKNRFVCFFIVFVLVVSGCDTLQPVSTVTTTTSTDLQFDNTNDLRNAFDCDSNYNVIWNIAMLEMWQKDSLFLITKEQKKQIDSLKNIGKVDQNPTYNFKKPIKGKINQTTEVKTPCPECPKCEPKIIIQKQIHPLTWVFAFTTILFLLCFIIAFYFWYKNTK
jgi:hypothetical protein